MQVQHQAVTLPDVFETAIYTLADGRQVAMTIAEDGPGKPISKNYSGACMVQLTGQLPWILNDQGQPWVGPTAIITEDLYRWMTREELEFVIMHEVGHFANDNMTSEAVAAIANPDISKEEALAACHADTPMEIAADAFAVSQVGMETAKRSMLGLMAFGASMAGWDVQKHIRGFRKINPGRLEALGI